jgi:hypothetical protein
MQWHTPGFAQDFFAWAARTSLAAAFLSNATPANTLPQPCANGPGGRGEVGGYQVSVYQNPKPARGSINGALSGLCQSSHRCSDNDLDCGFQTAT